MWLLYRYNTFPRHIQSCSSKVTLSNIRRGLVKVTFPSPLQYLKGSLSKPLSSFNVCFNTANVAFVSCIFLNDEKKSGVVVDISCIFLSSV